MRRRRAKADRTLPSLFPFLAVLICTMGAIIVLLVLVVKRADVQATEATATNEKEQAEKLQQVKDKIAVEDNRASLLQGLRPDLKERLGNEKALFGHIADHITRLQQEVEAKRKTIEQLANSQSDDIEKLKNQVVELEAEIESQKKKNAKLRKQFVGQKKSYAIIPQSTGSNGTFRRPIFVECTEQGATLQPYGITIRAEDLIASNGPGNPLDVALLMIRDYWNQVDPNQKEGQPYPLFVVRPNGALAFGASRKCMKSWVDEFGYELVTQDIDLTYPQVDSNFRDRLAKTIDQVLIQQRLSVAALERNRALSQARRLEPNSSGRSGSGSGSGGSGATYSASSVTGGFVKTKPTTSGTNSPYTNNQYQGTSSTPRNSTPRNSTPRSSTQFASQSRSSSNNFQNSSFQTKPSSSFDSENRGGLKNNELESGGIKNGGTINSPNNGLFVPNRDTMASKHPQSNSPASRQFQKSNQLNSNSNQRPTSFDPNHSAKLNSPTGGSAGGQATGSQQGNESGKPEPATSIANQRGKNWALPSKSENAIQIRKPIKVILTQKNLQIYEIGKGVRSIPFEGATSTAVPGLVEQVWKHVDAWGIAGVNSYWKPDLRFYVAPGAEDRFRELKQLMSGSGLGLESVK